MGDAADDMMFREIGGIPFDENGLWPHEKEQKMTTELVTLENLEKVDPVAIYTGQLDSVLTAIAAQVRTIPTDISTEKGRKAVGSLNLKIAKSKTFLDGLGAKLIEDAQAKVKAVNVDRKKARDFLEGLQEEVTKPLTEWKASEKARTDGHEAEITAMQALTEFNGEALSSDAILERSITLDVLFNRDWQEFAGRATLTKSGVQTRLRELHARAVEQEAKDAELERLRAADEERKKQADEAARIAHEEAIKAAAADAAREAERKRVADEQKVADEAREAREKDVEHRRQINNEILNALAAMDFVLGEIPAKKIVEAIALGQVPHVQILY